MTTPEGSNSAQRFQSVRTNLIFATYEDAPEDERKYLVPFSQKIQDDFGGAASYAHALIWGGLGDEMTVGEMRQKLANPDG